MNHEPWKSIFDKHQIHKHNFNKEPFIITAQQIKDATFHFEIGKKPLIIGSKLEKLD